MVLKLFAALAFVVVVSTVNAVPVIPNAALIRGIVLESEAISSNLLGMKPEQKIYRLLIHVISSEDVGKMANFVKGEEGKDMVFYTKDPLLSGIVKKGIKARVSYRGDERGGLWWIHEMEILN